MPRDWSREGWHKTYSREAGGWAALSFDARGLYRLLQDDASRDGIIDTGADSIGWAVAVYRIDRKRAESAFDELTFARLVVRESGQLSLPVHAEQQATISSSSERVRRYRDKSRNGETVTALHVTLPETPDVAPKRKDKKDKREKIEEIDTRARTREPAAASVQLEEVPSDPRVVMLADKLRAAKRFTHLPAVQVAEALLGKLGASAYQLDEGRADEAIAAAALEAEDGANERRLRQVLGWKLIDVLAPRKREKPGHLVQGLAPGQTVDDFIREIEESKKDAPWMKWDTDTTSEIF